MWYAILIVGIPFFVWLVLLALMRLSRLASTAGAPRYLSMLLLLMGVIQTILGIYYLVDDEATWRYVLAFGLALLFFASGLVEHRRLRRTHTSGDRGGVA